MLGSLTYNGPIKLFYRGPMFRHENVQKGRQRQFHQVGVEAFGYGDASSDAEQILLLKRLWKNLGLKNIELQLNTIGDPSDRKLYRKALIDYFEKNKSILDDDALLLSFLLLKYFSLLCHHLIFLNFFFLISRYRIPFIYGNND